MAKHTHSASQIARTQGQPADRLTEDQKRALRSAFGAFPTGVTVITTRQDDGVPRGFTANSFTSVSLDPPMLLVCLAKTAHSCQVFASAANFAVNVLSEEQKDISNLFASRNADKFEQVIWRPGQLNAPLLDGSLAWFECTRSNLVDAGDHLILIGTINDFGSIDGNPLGYHRGGYFSLSVDEDLIEAATKHSPSRLSALLQFGDEILLKNETDGSLSVPKAPRDVSTQEGLLQHIRDLGLNLSGLTLFAVYDDTDADQMGVVFRGTCSGSVPEGHVLLSIETIPLDRVHDPAERSMLERYRAESQMEDFGIYQGDVTSGTVHQINRF